MNLKVFFFFFIFCFGEIKGLIVPDEIPSLLSLIYSNIPPIKKGTDSRLGWGFRLGDHADFQILVELGPQLNTRKLGNDNNNNNNKRNAANNLKNTLYAQSQLLKQEKERQQQEKTEISNTDGGAWLQSWSESFKKYTPDSSDQPEPPMFAIGEIDASKAIPEELDEIYGHNSKNIQKISPNNLATTTEIEENATENNGATFLAKLARG